MNRKIKIAHIIESLGRGGAERLLITNLSYLDRSRFENTLIYLFKREDLLSEIIGIGIPNICLGMRSFYDWKKGFCSLRHILKEINPDIVHTVLQKADFYGRLAAKSLRKPTVISTLHECPYYPEVFVDNPDLNKFKYSIFKQLDKSSARLCNDGFIVVSQFTKQSLQRYFRVGDSKIKSIYSSIDLDYLDGIDGAAVDLIREDIGIEKDDVVLLNIGRMAPQKGQKYLILAMREVCNKMHNVKLLIRGDGPLRGYLTDLIFELGLEKTVFIVDKYRSYSEIRSLFQLCHAFVFPSLYEGLGIVLLEAMALRKPCVASNIGPIPEVIRDGQSGILVAPMDHVGLAGAIVNLLSYPEKMRAMGEEGRKIVEEKFNIRTNIKLLEGAYQELSKILRLRNMQCQNS